MGAGAADDGQSGHGVTVASAVWAETADASPLASHMRLFMLREECISDVEEGY